LANRELQQGNTRLRFALKDEDYSIAKIAWIADMKSLKSYPDILLWLVALGVFMETLDSTIVNTALPSMAANLHVPPLLMQSVIIAYALAIAILIPASGWVADRFGTQRTFMTAIVFFTLGSICCALSQTLPQLVTSRVLQGCGGAMLLPIGRLAVLRSFPAEKFLPAISFVAVPGLLGPLVGPTLGGWLVEYASWHWIFLINIPIGIVAGIMTYVAMPDFKSLVPRKFDIFGFLQISFMMLAISLALDGLAELGFQNATVMMLLVSGLAAFVGYILRARRHPQPLFSLHLFDSHSFSIGILGNLFARFGSSCMPFLIPLLLQVGLNFSPFDAGMNMLPVALASIASKRGGTSLIQRFGYRRILVVNTFLVVTVMMSFCLITPGEPTWLRIAQLLFFGAVNSLQFTAMNTLTLKDLPSDFASSGNSLLSMTQMLAMSFAVAAAGALLTTFSNRFGGAASPAAVLKSIQATFLCMGMLTCTSGWIFWQLPSRRESANAGV
jgi:EmrB/QacA subfamily drug resistance transporter